MPSTGKNKRLKEKLLSIRLSPDGLSFWTTGLVGAFAEDRPTPLRDYRTESAERAIAFDRKAGVRENIGKALSLCTQGIEVASAEILLDTCKTILVPGELYDESQTADYLEINGFSKSRTETVVRSEAGSGSRRVVAIMVFNEDAVDAVTDVFGEKAVFTSPVSLGQRLPSKYYADPVESIIKGRPAKPPGKLRKIAYKNNASVYLTGTNAYITVQTVSQGEFVYYEILPYSSPADILYYMLEIAGQFPEVRETPLYIKGKDAEKTSKVLRKSFKNCRCE